MTAPLLTYAEREAAFIPIVARVFGARAAYGCAIVAQESGWNPDVRVTSGRDGARGGAWGLFQMTLRTATGLDRRILTGQQLLDPAINCEVAYRLMAFDEHYCSIHAPVGYDLYRELASMHNSGRLYSEAPACTRETYVPRVLERMRAYEQSPLLKDTLSRVPLA